MKSKDFWMSKIILILYEKLFFIRMEVFDIKILGYGSLWFLQLHNLQCRQALLFSKRNERFLLSGSINTSDYPAEFDKYTCNWIER